MEHKLTNGTDAENLAQPIAQTSVKSIGKSCGNFCHNSGDKFCGKSADTPIIEPKEQIAVLNEDEIMSHAFLTIEEVATLLRVSKRTVYNLIYKGTLRATRVSYHVSIIPKADFLEMLEQNSYSNASIFTNRHKTKSTQRENIDETTLSESQHKAGTKASSSMCGQRITACLDGTNGTIVTEDTTTKANTNSAKTSKSKTKKRGSRKLIPSSAYSQSVRDTFIDGSEYRSDQLYTMAEICHKYDCKYGWFYNIRMKYNIPCVKANSTKCFPIEAVDKAITTERERLGLNETEHWYTCFDIMRLYGLGKTQVRRFAETHNVRIKKCGHINRYLKDDWEAARKKAEAISVSTKAKRE